MCARAPLFSSHVQSHNKVLVYKPNKNSSFFHVGQHLLKTIVFVFIEKPIVYNNLPHFSKERKIFVFKTYCLEYGRRC